MQGRQRRSFTDEYKRQAVELVVSSGRSIGAVAKELGLRDGRRHDLHVRQRIRQHDRRRIGFDRRIALSSGWLPSIEEIWCEEIRGYSYREGGASLLNIRYEQLIPSARPYTSPSPPFLICPYACFRYATLKRPISEN